MPTNIKKIKALCIKRAISIGEFTAFSSQLVSLGVFRQTYDVLENCLYFYSKESMLCKLPISEISNPQEELTFTIGDKLDMNKLNKAINNLDENCISIDEFHQAIAAAGIIYVSVFLDAKLIYYLGQDGNHFLEKY